MAMEGLQEDMGDGSMQCTDHPYKNNTPGGICAFCLQEKLGKLVSSSFPAAVFPSSSSSSSPSFRSDLGGGVASAVQVGPNASSSAISGNGRIGINDCRYHSRRARLPFPLIQRKKKKKDDNMMVAGAAQDKVVFKRSKSTTTPRRRGAHFLDAGDVDEYSPQKRGFWSFLYLSKHSTSRKIDRPFGDISYGSASTASGTGGAAGANGGSFSSRLRDKKKELLVVVDENESPNQASFDGKVSRSRSLGCGSRSFSGDFFERISTGFGDCTLRRVESQREGKSKVATVHRRGGQDCMKERVKCAGIFSGFMITSSSSSSSSSSYWVSSAEENINGKTPSASAAAHLNHGRSKSWGWAFASPIRAFGKPSSGKRDAASNKNTAPNLAAIPSLLAVRS